MVIEPVSFSLSFKYDLHFAGFYFCSVGGCWLLELCSSLPNDRKIVCLFRPDKLLDLPIGVAENSYHFFWRNEEEIKPRADRFRKAHSDSDLPRHPANLFFGSKEKFPPARKPYARPLPAANLMARRSNGDH